MENERIPYQACPLCEFVDIEKLTTVNCTGHAMWREPLEPFIVWLQCQNCQHVFTEGYFTDEALHVLFGNTQEQQIVGGDMEMHRNISARMIGRVIDAIGLPNNRLWLDVGFGNGSLLLTASEFGFEVLGVDLRKKNVEDIQKFGINAYHGTLQELQKHAKPTPKPSVISMADVVEHEPFPLTTLRCAREIINEPGMLLISMPNASAPLWNHWNSINQNPYWHEIEHYHNFTREKLYAVLEESGFKATHYATSERYRCCMEVLAAAV